MLKKYESYSKDMLKDIILEQCDDPKFWGVVDAINWQKLIKGSWKNVAYHQDQYVEKGKEILLTFDVETVQYVEDKYNKLYDNLSKYFQSIWLSDSNREGPSDDGYTDLMSSMVGFGKDFVIAALNSPRSVFMDMATNDKYAENFGYIFHKD